MSSLDYSKTVNLPQTDFPMKGDLARREPERLAFWEKTGLYGKIQKLHEKDPLFVLHDGPPYANGPIHIGHALNKILKDIIVKYKALSGHRAPYIPGWDCHGLPIENQLMKDLKATKHTIERGKFRKEAAGFASRFVDLQKEEFKRLGVLGDWEKPYLTMAPDYEASILEVFYDLLNRGYVYRGRKPVYWCAVCETALADAEVEYEDRTSDSAYVRFPLLEDAATGVLIWTTTPWTLPANVGLAFHPRETYVLAEVPSQGRVWVAEKRLEALSNALKASVQPTGERAKGEELIRKGLKARNPLTERVSTGVTAEYVSMEDGTGVVHIAPGHGVDDYVVGHLQNKLEILSPVDERGRFTAEVGVPGLEGKHVLKDANEAVLEKLGGALVHRDKVQHSYPCCWRCRKPVIFRATEQWFLSVDKDNLRHNLIALLKSGVRFVPAYGINRMIGMLEARPDWCLTRQRYWGTPLAVLYCASCGTPFHPPAFQGKVLKFIEEKGSDAWFDAPVSEFVPRDARCPCGKSEFKKEEDILDVWFDSGVSWRAVIDKRPELQGKSEAVLYLEGSDQHRGWFQTSLIPSVAFQERGEAPFTDILTHGFVVDGQGQKMSKSLGNVIAPQEIVKKSGADILRLWVGLSDYANEVRVSEPILNQGIEIYRRLRNTFRYLLGNISDFKTEYSIPIAEMEELDRFALNGLASLVDVASSRYDDYEFQRVVRDTTDFCINRLSGFYLDIQKDTLYCERADSKIRRSAQTAFLEIARTLSWLLAPVLSFTMEEVWQDLRARGLVDEESVFLISWTASARESWLAARLDERWAPWYERYLPLRGEVFKVLEEGRGAGRWGSPLEAVVTIDEGSSPFKDILPTREPEFWARIFQVSGVRFERGRNGKWVSAEKSAGTKCPRCWRWREDIGRDGAFPEVCLRCAGVLATSPPAAGAGQ